MISPKNKTKNIEQYLVGLTGNICSGKTQAAEYFKQLGAYVIDADRVVHGLYKKNILLKYDIYKKFGLKVFNKKLEVDRKKLGRIVFSDESKMKDLETIVWPYVGKETRKMIKNQEGIIVIEAAMLYESGMYKKLDKNVVVLASEGQQAKRLMQRDKLSYEEALKRINLQTPPFDKILKSNYIIFNNTSLESLKACVEKTWESLSKDFFKN